MVDARCDAVGSEERPFLGSFQKGGGARNGAERRAEPRSIKGGHARGAPSSPLLFPLLVSDALSSLHGLCALLGSCSLPPRSSCARGPARPVGGDADGRRRSAACGGPACPDEGCRRGFAGRVGGRNQARPRQRSWEGDSTAAKGGPFFSFLFVWMLWLRVCK